MAAVQGIPFADAQALTDAIAPQVGEVEVTTRTTGESFFGGSLGQFDLGASSQLVLFMFLTGLTGSAALIQSRQLGVTTRMLGTPATSWSPWTTPPARTCAGRPPHRHASARILP